MKIQKKENEIFLVKTKEYIEREIQNQKQNWNTY